MKTLSILALMLFTIIPSIADDKKSLLNNDPDVVYLKEHLERSIHLMTTQSVTVYSSKNGGRRLGSIPAKTKVELIAITEKAYKVKGKARHNTLSGWVSPKLMASKDKNFIANLKKLYKRQLIVKELIAAKQVAIGMTLDEVKAALGKPTETEVRQTREGETGKWDYVVSIEQKHYRTLYDQYGHPYRQLSHITTEEKSRTTIEFEKGLVSAVTRKKNNGPGKVRIIPAPVVFVW
ncbi:MAG: hypothetical protein ACPG32_00685 [Akkermansiaceae bacterium]